VQIKRINKIPVRILCGGVGCELICLKSRRPSRAWASRAWTCVRPWPLRSAYWPLGRTLD